MVGRAPEGAHEALPHTSPGGKPPETPGPLSLGLDCTEGRKSVKGSLRRHTPPLTDFLPSEETHSGYEGKGAMGGALAYLPLVGPGDHAKREAGFLLLGKGLCVESRERGDSPS